MIVLRRCDRRFPFLWETANQPEARWHRCDEGPVQYLADTPDGAWGPTSYPICQLEADRVRATGASGVRAPWAALLPGGGAGHRVDAGLRDAPVRNGEVHVLFGKRPDAIGCSLVLDGRSPDEVLRRVGEL